MSKKRKKQKQNNIPSQSISSSNTISDNEEYRKTIDIREKRIGIVFKVIYVVAFFFVAIFAIVGENQGKGLTDIYIIECAVAAFLLCLLYRMVVYIFNELKCLKLNHDDLSHRQSEKTESSYSHIFTYFSVCGVTSIFSVLALSLARENLTENILIYVFIGLVILGSVIGNAYISKNRVLWSSVSDICWLLAIVVIFIAMGMVSI